MYVPSSKPKFNIETSLNSKVIEKKSRNNLTKKIFITSMIILFISFLIYIIWLDTPYENEFIDYTNIQYSQQSKVIKGIINEYLIKNNIKKSNNDIITYENIDDLKKLTSHDDFNLIVKIHDEKIIFKLNYQGRFYTGYYIVDVVRNK